MRSFFTAFLKESVHRYSSVNIDLTPAFIAVLVFGVVWLLYRQRSVTLTEGKKLIGYELLIFLITYSMLLFAHLTMFYHETAYLESSKMIEQMTRYSSPANLGLLMLSIALLLRHGKEKGFPKKASMAAICVLIVCCSGWGVVVDGFIPGHDRLDPQRQQLREDIFNEYKPFIEAVGSISADDPCGRILLCEEGEGFGSKLPIIGYLVSPRSMMGVELNDGLSGKDVLLLAKNGHCGYLYITEGSDLQKKELTAALGLDREFQWGRLYHITDPLK